MQFLRLHDQKPCKWCSDCTGNATIRDRKGNFMCENSRANLENNVAKAVPTFKESRILAEYTLEPLMRCSNVSNSKLRG